MASKDADRPNIVVVLTDDQGAWAMGCAGNAELRTPHLDRLAAEGVRFESFFCTSPVCSPARASLLTGRIPSQHGIHDWLRSGNSVCEPEIDGRLIEYLKGQTGYTNLLAAQGWTCGLSGKWHLGDCHHAQKGFTFWRAHTRGGGSYYNAPLVKDAESIYFEPRYVTDVFTDNAIEFLDAQARTDDPFYLSLHYTAPHSPWGRDQHPPEYFDPYFNDCPFESIPDTPMHPAARANLEFFEEEGKRREWLSAYYASIEAMDAGVGRVLDWLEEHGLRENTLVFFTGDNGMNMGHHGICGKGNGTRPINMYDTSVKVPAIMSRPGHLPSGMTATGLYSHYDFMPTLLDYVGIEMPDEVRLPGRSFAELLRTGREAEDAGEVVVFDEYGYTRMIRTRRWKYVHRYPAGPRELYDLTSDPDEEEDVVREPERRERVAAMSEQLERWFRRYVIPATDGSRKAVEGWGQTDTAWGAGDDADSFLGDFPHGWWREGYEPPHE
jgi:arylsulfatase A-like enzyme